MSRATIPPLDSRTPIIDPETGNPTLQFMRLWQQLFGNEGGTYTAVSDTSTGLDTKVPQTRLINTTAPIAGGGDLTADLTLSHNASGVTAAVYGDATHIPQVTIDAKGHVTAASNIAISAGAGTVTSVSVVTANGVSGSVANPTTTPAITLTLGAITPSSVAATGIVTGSNLSGTNTGDQTITLTGNVTGSGTGSFATTIPAGTVTLAMQANMATSSLFYRKTAGSGAPEVNTLATLKTDLLLTGTNSGDQTITLTGDVTGSGTGSFAATIAAGAVSLAKQANVATSTVFYRKTAGTGAPEVNTLATLKTDLGITGTNSGDQTITLTGDVTGSGTGSFAATIANAAVTLAKIANASASSRLVGSGASGSGASYSEIALGTNLSMSGTTLNAVAGGGGALPGIGLSMMLATRQISP